MKQRRHLKIMGFMYACGVLIFVLLLLSGELDTLGVQIGIVLSLLFAYKSYSYFKQMKNTDYEEKVALPYSLPGNSSNGEKINYYKKILWIGMPAFILLSIWTWYDLSSLESGQESSVNVWAPISFLYDLGGYWTAVLATPVLGILILVVLLTTIGNLKKEKVQL